MRNKQLEAYKYQRDLFSTVFGSEAGEQVLLKIAKEACLTKSTYVKNDHDLTMMNEGARRLALSICKQARKSHADIVALIEREYNDE